MGNHSSARIYSSYARGGINPRAVGIHRRQFREGLNPRRNFTGRRGGADVIKMGSTNSRKGACGNIRRSLDAHVSGELDAAAMRETRAHLESCESCAALFEERLRLRNLLRRAVCGVTAPPHLAGAIRTMIRQG